jgi:hypothetical protein
MAGTSKLPCGIGPLAGPYGRDSIPTRCPRQSFLCRRDCGGRLQRREIEFSQGLDARLLTDEVAAALTDLHLPTQFGVPMIFPRWRRASKEQSGLVRAAACEVRLWHLADVPLALTNVCFEGKNGHEPDALAMSANDPKRTFWDAFRLRSKTICADARSVLIASSTPRAPRIALRRHSKSAVASRLPTRSPRVRCFPS